jgi:hypothetical protein
MGGNLGKLEERRKCFPSSIHAMLGLFSSGCESGTVEFSRLPDSATLAPLRLVELALRQG